MYLSDTEFWEKHDTKKEGALMMYLQEAGVGANRRNSNALKSRITSPYIDINPKGMRSYKVPNMAMYFMTTNESSPVNMEENDRRYYLLRAGNKNMGNADYWKYIYENYNKPAWMYSLGKHLERIDLTGFNPNTFPDTQERIALKLLGKCPEKLFLQQFTWPEGSYTTSSLYKEYKVFCMDNDLAYRQSSPAFGKELVKYLNDLVERKVRDGYSVFSSRAK
jgi:phage/plasmid-associated DNA primase